MQNKSLVFALILAGVLVGAGHLLGIYAFLYWSLWWYSSLLHFWGGFLLGASVLLLLPKTKFSYTVGLVLAIGVVWEVFELGTGSMIWGSTGYFSNTLSDLAFDAAGASAALLFARAKLSSVLPDRQRALAPQPR